MNTFKADVDEIRRRALERMTDGAVTAFYKADKDKVIEVLNEVLATETVCTLRYKSHYFRAYGIHASGVENEFLEHAKEEQEHADLVAKRITPGPDGEDVPVNCPADAFTGPRQALELIGAEVPETTALPLPGVAPSGTPPVTSVPRPAG